jgi:hypothetical protein
MICLKMLINISRVQHQIIGLANDKFERSKKVVLAQYEVLT